MHFTKMQGAGNDYVYIDCFRQPVPRDPGALSRSISDRHFGVGADGLILICRSEVADARMRMFNADGSEGEMCGNGIRCVAKYIYEHASASVARPAHTGPLARDQEMSIGPSVRIETRRGVLEVRLDVEDGVIRQAVVDMGEPILEAGRIPTALPGTPPLDVELSVGGRDVRVTCVSMGNPHCILFLDEVSDTIVHGLGPAIERHAAFPRRTNVEFVQVNNPGEVTIRVWERGSGETLACGTGACAVAVAGVLAGRTRRDVVAHLPGGKLELRWQENDNHVYLAGPAVEVFTGDWPEER